LAGFSRKPTVATVSKICGFNGTSGSYSPQGFTTRQITGNLPIAGRSTKGLLSLPFSFISMLLKFLWNEGKNYCSFSHVKTVKRIKTDRILSAENIQIVSFKNLRTIEICGTGESIYNKTANKLSKSLGIVIGNGPLKVSNFSINPDQIKTSFLRM
jgi:hypothetical protein